MKTGISPKRMFEQPPFLVLNKQCLMSGHVHTLCFLLFIKNMCSFASKKNRLFWNMMLTKRPQKRLRSQVCPTKSQTTISKNFYIAFRFSLSHSFRNGIRMFFLKKVNPFVKTGLFFMMEWQREEGQGAMGRKNAESYAPKTTFNLELVNSTIFF